MKFLVGSGALFVLAGIFGALPTFGAEQWTVESGGNGHWYAVISDGGSCWEELKVHAEGQGGYLATITSQQEQSFIENNLDISDWNWLGGYQDTTDPEYSEPSGGWKWITGESWKYTNWDPTEPNDTNGSENYLNMFIGGSNWNDNGSCGAGNYIIEWDTNPNIRHWSISEGGNGHWYLGVPAPKGISWLDANDAAIAMGGYLATLTSEEEDSFVSFTICEPEDLWNWDGGVARGPWFGAQVTVDNCPDGEMFWVTGELWDYTRWHPGNPNCTDCTCGIQFWGYGNRTWNDNHDDDPTRANGYIVEFTTMPGETFGACCVAGECATVNSSGCAGLGGDWGGSDSSCLDLACDIPCPSDLNGDGAVEVDDLLVLIAAWGSCP
ncbi:MAG: lectin-like protein [Phycisphaerales bacterium]|jgi:hypothetical protein|nr:lectin-like protein [Phycisphaerales bacterium]